MPWAGWGAGPAGAGSSGGPSRWFLAIMLAGAAFVTVILAVQGSWLLAVVGAAATVYLASRVLLGFGRKGGPRAGA